MLPVTTPSSWRHPWGHRGAEIPSHSSATRYSGPALLFHLGGVQQGPRRGSHTRHVHPPASPEDGLKGRQRETGGEDVKQGLITLEAFMTKIKIHPSHQEPGKVQVELKKKKIKKHHNLMTRCQNYLTRFPGGQITVLIITLLQADMSSN